MNNIYTYEIWDKESNIGSKTKEDIYRNFPHLKDSEVFILKKCGVVCEINSINLIRANLCINEDATSEQVVQKYIDNIELSTEDKISILEAENADLLLDSAIKDSKIQTLENDLADLTLEIAMMEVR